MTATPCSGALRRGQERPRLLADDRGGVGSGPSAVVADGGLAHLGDQRSHVARVCVLEVEDADGPLSRRDVLGVGDAEGTEALCGCVPREHLRTHADDLFSSGEEGDLSCGPPIGVHVSPWCSKSVDGA